MIFGVGESIGVTPNSVRHEQKSLFKMAATQTGSTYISDFSLSLTWGNILRGAIEFSVLKNMPFAFEITFLSRLEGKIHVLPVWMVAILDFQILVSLSSRDTVTISPYFIKLVILIKVSFRFVTKR
jgi:hypothetical protein